jgi:hypothetical protein
MGWRWPAALALVALLAGPPAARAGGTAFRVEPTGNVYGHGGPALAGDRVVWGREAPAGGYYVESAALDGSQPDRQHIDAPSTGYGPRVLMAVAASTRRVGVGLSVENCDNYSACHAFYYRKLYEGALSAPLGQRLDLMAGCTSMAGCDHHYCSTSQTMDVSGPVVAYQDCHDAVVRDYDEPALPVERRFPGHDMVAVAGSMLAARDREVRGLRVYDWRTGQARFHLDLPITAADVRADGTLAFVLSRPGVAQEVAWATQDEPSAHPLAEATDFIRGVRIAGDRIAYAHSFDLSVRTLSGALVAGVEDRGLTQDFDFDGAHLTWASRPCASKFVLVWDLAGDPPAPPAGPCPVASIPRGPVAPDVAKPRLPVRFDCPERPELGCSTNVEITARRNDGRRGRVTLAAGYVAQDPGASEERRLRISHGAVCAVGRGSVRTRATLASGSLTRTVALRVTGLAPLLRDCRRPAQG